VDDPSFNAPIYANLFDDEDGEDVTLIERRNSMEFFRDQAADQFERYTGYPITVSRTSIHLMLVRSMMFAQFELKATVPVSNGATRR
jgi:hypothetical protein